MKSSEHQNVVVMRHGDRIDNFDPLWTATAARPWDPPLIDAGKVRAFDAGRNFRTQLGFPIHRVLVSPFLRCVQTASEVVSALCAAADDLDRDRMTSRGLKIDPSKIKTERREKTSASCAAVRALDLEFWTAGRKSRNAKVSIEYGLCEMLNKEAIRLDVAPKDGNLNFNISELEAMFPAGTVDHSVELVYQELPQWEETVTSARARYTQICKALAEKFPSENLLLVTHAEGVGTVFSASLKNITVYEVEYCAYAHLRRPVSFGDDESFTAGEFEVFKPEDHTGIRYYSSSTVEDDHLTL